MVKQKKNKLSMFSYIKSIYDYKLFTSELSVLSISLYSLITLIIITLLNGINSNYSYTSFSTSQSMLYTFLFTPVILFVFYVLFFIFLNAFEQNRKEFWKSFFVFFTISMPFFIIGHLLNIVQNMFITNQTIIIITTAFIIALVIYFFINISLSFKYYYKTTGYKVAVSLILVNMLIGLLLLLQYISYFLLNSGGK